MKQTFTKSFLVVAALVASMNFGMAQNKTVSPDADAASLLAQPSLVSVPAPQGAALWDVLYIYDLLMLSDGNGNAGVGIINNEFWVSRWNQDTLLLIDNMGNLVTKFSVPGLYVGGTGNARAFTSDGTFLYAGVNTTSIKKIDPGTVAIIGTVPAPVAARSLSYDPTANSGAGGFWVSNFNTDIYQISMTGAILNTISAATHGLTAMYGTAVDVWTPGGPTLWVYDQGGTASTLVQINPVSGLQTGVLHDVNADVFPVTGSNGIAGGVFINPKPGMLEMSCVVQGNSGTITDALIGYDMDVAVGLSQIQGPKGFLHINPSITSDWLNIHIDKNNNDPVWLQVVDITGKVVIDKTTHGINNYFNVSRYSNGLYFVRISYAGQTYTGHFMKM